MFFERIFKRGRARSQFVLQLGGMGAHLTGQNTLRGLFGFGRMLVFKGRKAKGSAAPVLSLYHKASALLPGLGSGEREERVQ